MFSIINKLGYLQYLSLHLTIASGRFARGFVSGSSTIFERFLASVGSRANGRS